ncbi:MAG: fibronectin type III domain-containing protein [Bacteroidales bacterium]|jgi:hypothetical protein|nr:fibronectin type III domain-containing protein [Bacteroidales bacterium]MCI2144853.1 fibronectin type III domain-containing protein [Bacteroidales bacterium]
MKKIIITSIIIALAGIFTMSCTKNDQTVDTLAAPTGVSATLGESSISVRWDEVQGAAFYILYYKVSSDNGFSKTDPLSTTNYTLTDIKEGVTYEFKVRAASNTAASGFCELVSLVVPEPETPPVPNAETPVVSNVRAGLGWVNFTMATVDTPCSYVCYNGTVALASAPVLVSTDETAGTAEYSLTGLDLSKTYSGLSVKRVVDGYNDSEAAPLGEVTTGGITVLTRNNSPRHLAFGWDDVAADANWTFDADIDPLTRTYKVELATDAAFKHIIYSIYTVNNFNAASGAFNNNNWIGESGTPESPAKPYANANTEVTFSQLEPSTTYYFRVRTAAGESVPNYVDNDGSMIQMNAKSGRSGWSATVSAATAAAHTPSGNELLYQGFDDHAFQCDPFNCTAGMVPVGKDITYSYPWKGEWGFLTPHTSLRYDEFGASAVGTFPGGGESKLDGLAVYTMDTDIFPSMKGWFCAKACYPLQGSLKIGGSGGQKNYIITPAFNGIGADTKVAISCDAAAYHASATPARLNIKVYRAASKSLENLLTEDLPACGAEISPKNDGYHNMVNMLNYSVEATLQPGDYVMFESETVKSPAINRLLIDNILIVKK